MKLRLFILVKLLLVGSGWIYVGYRPFLTGKDLGLGGFDKGLFFK